MSYNPLPAIADLESVSNQKSILGWLQDVFKSFNIGVTGTYNFDASASGTVQKIYIKNGIIYQVDLVP